MTSNNPLSVMFTGTVVNTTDDPLQLGRVKVRVTNHHEELTEDDLQWMTVGMPTTSPSIKGIGTSPTWLLVDTIVFGMYLDGDDRQVPIIMGTLPVIPNRDNNLHSVSKPARGQPHQYNQRGPDISGSPQYGSNKTITTNSGHIIEIDDTQGSERIVVMHKTGSSISINSSGDVIVNSINDTYHFTSGNSTTKTDGTANIQAKSINIVSDSDINIKASGKCSITSSSTISLTAPKVSIL